MSDDLKQMKQEVEAAAAAPRPYQKPVLQEMGDVRALTLGPSPGIGESGNEGTLKGLSFP